MRRAERTLTVLLVIFVALTFALVALLFVYNFVLTDGGTGPFQVEAAEPYPTQLATETSAEAVGVYIASGTPLTQAPSEQERPQEPEPPQHQPGRVDAYTRLVFERNYVLDGIVLTNEEAIPHFAINMDMENFAQIYTDWDIVSFTPQLVTMRRNIVDQRAEYYLIAEHDGFVAVYRQTGGAPPRLLEITRMPISTLSAPEQARLREGIVVYNEEALLRILQDYES